MLYITSPGFIPFLTGSLYLLTIFAYLPHPHPLPLTTTSLLCFYEFRFLDSHINEINICLSLTWLGIMPSRPLHFWIVLTEDMASTRTETHGRARATPVLPSDGALFQICLLKNDFFFNWHTYACTHTLHKNLYNFK